MFKSLINNYFYLLNTFIYTYLANYIYFIILHTLIMVKCIKYAKKAAGISATFLIGR